MQLLHGHGNRLEQVRLHSADSLHGIQSLIKSLDCQHSSTIDHFELMRTSTHARAAAVYELAMHLPPPNKYRPVAAQKDNISQDACIPVDT